MNELIPFNENSLPATLEDLSKFVLIGQEKLVALKAEIRAISKAKLAEEVLEQKREESRRLSDLILLAAVRIGELTPAIPTKSGARTDIEPAAAAAIGSQHQTKKNAIEQMGLTQRQASRFETIASHPEEVAQARAKAASEKRPVTQTEVLNLIKIKEERARAEDRQIDEDARLAKQLTKTLAPILLLPTDRSAVEAMRRGIPSEIVVDTINDIEQSIGILRTILLGFKAKGG